MIRVLIVDDMKILRECLRLAIEKRPEFEVVGCAGDGKEAIELYKKYKPDIILMDLNMPVYSGYDAIRDIKAIDNEVKILVLSVEDNERNISVAFRNGADGYVLKDICPDDLSYTMFHTYHGTEYAIENAFSLGKNVIKTEQSRSNDINILDNFTAREKEVLELVMEGMTNEEIAETLDISVGRARNIVTDLIAKCMVKNRTQLAVVAVKIYMHL